MISSRLKKNNFYILHTIAMVVVQILLVEQTQAQCTTGDCSNGKGRYVYKNGDKYIGEFKDNKRHGRGNYYYTSGNIYKGQFSDNNRHGYGTYTWKNGDTYIGEYKDNKRHGEGTYYFVNNSRPAIKGVWKDNELLPPPPEPKIDSTADIVTNDTKQDPFSPDNQLDVVSDGVLKYTPTAGIVEGQARTALVIGNSSYVDAPLKNPVNDAKAIADELQRSGFEVYLYMESSQKAMKKAIRNFGQVLKEKGGVGLFFYAGHGLQTDGRNYLLPIQADIEKIEDIEFEAVDLARVLVEMEYAANDMNIVILDACRDNPYKEDFMSSNRTSGHNGLASVNSAPYNSLIAFSTAPGSTAHDGDGENGLYTQELLKMMRMDGLKIEDVFKKVRGNVRKASDGDQIPWETSSVEDDFYFKH
ncbi:MAG: caspase family protein [Saprospiraceae bacterium]|nr:caspase family protein [Saprospiraceae bacterium]